MFLLRIFENNTHQKICFLWLPNFLAFAAAAGLPSRQLLKPK
jgi:hypothetical protein